MVAMHHGLSNQKIRRSAVLSCLIMFLVACVTTNAIYALRQKNAAAIPAATYRVGSADAERDWAYEHSPKIASSQRWYDQWEQDQTVVRVDAFELDIRLVSQADYAGFVAITRHRQPYISKGDYKKQGFLIHPYDSVKPYLWQKAQPLPELRDHPVVLVDAHDASAYCQWRGGRLPSEHEWAAACHSRSGNRFAWGNNWNPSALQHNALQTTQVYGHPNGQTPDGIQDMLGNVFEWTSDAFDDHRQALRSCSWDDAPGSCRCAFRHGRPAESKHILIGFRCAYDVEPY